MRPDRVQVRDEIGGKKMLDSIRRLHEQRPDAPCLFVFVVSHAVEQLDRSAIVEDLVSDLEIGSECRFWARCRPDHQGLHLNSSFADLQVQFWRRAASAPLAMATPGLHSLAKPALAPPLAGADSTADSGGTSRMGIIVLFEG
jgi:hypothetical protein